MQVGLLLTCLCDAFYGEVGIATVKVLEHVGCEVEFAESQTCCSQPPYNAGDWDQARPVAQRCADVLFSSGLPVVVPSSSCAAMISVGYQELGISLNSKVFELSQFLVHEMGVTSWPAAKAYERTIAFHRACHGRELGLKQEQEMLLRSIAGITLVDFRDPDQCCGFGGSFSATHPSLSASIGKEKLKNLIDSGATEVVSGDMGCLMHLKGLIAKENLPLQARHFVEMLAQVIET